MKRSICILTLVLTTSTIAVAQDTGDTATADPGSAAAATSGAPDGFSGGDYEVTDVNPALYGKVTRAQRVPEFHNVADGDSLWSICAKYYEDPWSWPQLWANNPTITNPHWIYPGDKIRLIGSSEVRSGGAPDESTLTVVRFASRSMVDDDTGPVFLRQHTFVDAKEHEKGGKIIGSKEYRKMLTSHDQIYIEGDDNLDLELGKEYSVYRVHREIKDKKGNKLGYVVEVLGSARVQRVNDKHVATADIVDFLNAVERGDRVGPLRQIEKELPPRPAKVSLDSTIIEMFREEGRLFADTDIVYLGHGSEQGVEPGNRFLVLRQGDGEKRMAQDIETRDERFPSETIGEVLVVDTRPNVSVGVLQNTRMEVRKGDKVSLRQGY